MESIVLVANEMARITAGGGGGGVDPKQVAEFERLMKEVKQPESGMDHYLPRVESPIEALSTSVFRVGSEVARTFRVQTEQANLKISDLDRSDPAQLFEHLLDLQKGVYNASFQIQFVTGLVESANKGISTLFHIQG